MGENPWGTEAAFASFCYVEQDYKPRRGKKKRYVL